MRHSFTRLSLIFLLASLSGAQQTSPPKGHPAGKSNTRVSPEPTFSPRLPSEQTVNAFLQQMFGYNPSVTWKVSEIRPSQAEGLAEVSVVITGPQGAQPNKLYVTADGQHAITGEIIPFGAHPFDADRKKLEKGADGPARGPADAPVSLVEFSDLQCPHCKQVQPIIDKLLAEEKGARLVFQNFPLPSHGWAAKASAYADCIGRSSNDAFWKFVQGSYDAQAEITAANADQKLTGLADAAGVKGADIAVCADKAETVGRVERSMEVGRSLDVTGTPTLFINGRKIANIGGIPYDMLKSLVEFAAKQEK